MHKFACVPSRPIQSVVAVSHPRHIQDAIRFNLLREVAQGGMGIVYEAEQKGAEGFSKRVAIKVIRDEFADHGSFRRNFIGEARLVSNLIHSNIVQIYHLGVAKNQCYMVMEWVDGVNLEAFIDLHEECGRPIPVEWACFIISRICRGLEHAHLKTDAMGRPMDLVHRDVNPRNILLSRQGDVKLTDFGIAKAIQFMDNREGEVVAGQDSYLSPEQASREITDRRTDIFACGIVLAEMICGYNVFEGESAAATRSNVLRMPLPDWHRLRPDLENELLKILDRCLQRNRELRYPTAGALLEALERYLYCGGYGPTNEKLAAYLRSIEETANTPERQ